MNPPYGERMKKSDLESFYNMIGDILKPKYTGCEAWIISSDLKAIKKIGLRTSEKKILFNGSLECRFNKYELYERSRK